MNETKPAEASYNVYWYREIKAQKHAGACRELGERLFDALREITHEDGAKRSAAITRAKALVDVIEGNI